MLIKNANSKSASYRLQIVSILNTFLAWCKKQGYLQEVPDLSGIIIERVKRKKVKCPPFDPSFLKTPEAEIQYLMIVESELNNIKMLPYLKFTDFNKNGECVLKNGNKIKVSLRVIQLLDQISHKNEDQYIFKKWDDNKAPSSRTL